MKKIKKTLSAIMAAAVIFGTAAMPVSAYNLKVTNGITYKYDDNSNLIGKFSGWTKTDGVSQRYVDGKPYTGWLKEKSGARKYCLDGYLVKGELPIGKNICTFDEDGILTEKTPAKMTITQDVPIHSGDKVIPLTAKLLGKGGYDMVPSSKFERWENGKWVDCLGEGIEYITCDCLYTLDSEGYFDEKIFEEKFSFEPEEYMGTEITAGYYRLTYGADGLFSEGGLIVYAIIKVTDSNTL